MIPEVQPDQVLLERQVVLLNSEEIRIKVPLEFDESKPYRQPLFGNKLASDNQFIELGSNPLNAQSVFSRVLVSVHRFSTVCVGGKSKPNIRITFDIKDVLVENIPVPVVPRRRVN